MSNFQSLYNLSSVNVNIGEIDDLVVTNSIDETDAQIIGFGDDETINTNEDGKLQVKPGRTGKFSSLYVDNIYEYSAGHTIIVNSAIKLADVFAFNVNGTAFKNLIKIEQNALIARMGPLFESLIRVEGGFLIHGSVNVNIISGIEFESLHVTSQITHDYETFCDGPIYVNNIYKRDGTLITIHNLTSFNSLVSF